MQSTQHTIDTDAVRARARKMSIAELEWNANDAHEAAIAAEELERAGVSVSKTGGFYRDEATEYRVELGRRLSALGDGDEITVGQEVRVMFTHTVHPSRCTVKSIDIDGRDVRVIKKDDAGKDGVTFSLEDGRWAYGFQVEARQSGAEIDALRVTNTLNPRG
tara:strand:- start:3681 stop:4166 length:486 start_codon:yes stop_codon:yes gene_type:complete